MSVRQANLSQFETREESGEQCSLFDWARNVGDSPNPHEVEHETTYWRYQPRNPATGRFARACDLTY